MRVDQIEIHAGAVDFGYEPVRRLEVKCEARTNFSASPTIADANAKLQELAAGLGANAVIDVRYDNGVSWTSWRSLKATGLAVKRISDEIQCPRCAETIKRAASVCRFCGAEIGAPRSISDVAAPRQPNSPPTAPQYVRRTIEQEPVRATNNSQIGIFVAIGVILLIWIMSSLAS